DDSTCGTTTFCFGTVACSPVMGCITTGPADCDDAKSCTTDFCDPGSDTCAHVKQDAACSNGVFCDGNEVCDAGPSTNATGCIAGSPVSCNDGIPCTSGVCDEGLKDCIQTANHALCQ